MMMMKGMMISPHEHSLIEENMSNLTSASGDQTSVSSGLQAQVPPKKKRNLPGNPDPEAEVIALSPHTLMATNRFVCEICNKGFQRDQNLQLHRRGHNLPWKLKQRNSKEVIRKKVYVCPEASCVHHDPSRALGDLTGIKKHFCRKHGEKKWKCEKCTKCYAVQSDWKAHSKICGTREYRCDCGTLFSRRDSFITHRAFCDALAEESAKSITTANIHQPLLLIPSQTTTPTIGTASKFQPHSFNTSLMTFDNPHAHSMKQEQQTFSTTSPLLKYHHYNVNPSPNPSPVEQGGPIHFLAGPGLMNSTTGGNTPHMSATALLQKAAQMGATMSTTDSTAMIMPHNQAHVTTNTTTGFGLHLSSRDQHQLSTGFLSSFGNKAAPPPTADHYHQLSSAHSFLQDMMMTQGFVDDQDYGFTTPAGQECRNIEGQFRKTAAAPNRDQLVGIPGNDDGMTRDFLGLRPLSHAEILRITALRDQCNAPTAGDHPDHRD